MYITEYHTHSPKFSLLEADNQKYKVLVSDCENLY